MVWLWQLNQPLNEKLAKVENRAIDEVGLSTDESLMNAPLVIGDGERLNHGTRFDDMVSSATTQLLHL